MSTMQLGSSLTIVALLAAGCVATDTVLCADGKSLCPGGTSCVAVENGTYSCATRDQIDACLGDGIACTTGGGACHGGVCLPVVCGNELLDPGETCDDGNLVFGDGCSLSCLSNEVCGNGVVDGSLGELCDDRNPLSHDGCDRTCVPEIARWRKLLPGTPEARVDPALAYDAARRRVVLFGGSGVGAFLLGDTWLWDGRGWVAATPSYPPASRTGAMMAYDQRRDRVVLFGGRTGPTTFMTDEVLDDTWEWDGAEWQPLDLPANGRPSPRSNAAIAYDAKRQVTVLFGGIRDAGILSVPLADTWEWNGSAWTDRGSGPPGLTAVAGAFDPARAVTVVYGIDATGSAIWEWNGTSWTHVALTGAVPSARVGASLAYDPETRKVQLYGGEVSTIKLDEQWSWDGTLFTLVGPNVVGPRAGHRVVTDGARRGMFLFGGSGELTLKAADNVTARSDAGTWEVLDTMAPTRIQRTGAAIALDERRRRVIIFGGEIRSGSSGASPPPPEPVYDTLELIDDTVRVLPSTNAPSTRVDAAMAYHVRLDKIVLFGGCLDDEATYLLVGSVWSVAAPGPQPGRRCGHSMVYDADHETIVLFGGDVTSDTWLWNGTWTQASPPGPLPPARRNAAFGYDQVRGRAVLFGGQGAAGELDDLWEWDGQAWTNIQVPTRPTARRSATFTWDAARRRLVLFGGERGSTRFDDVWDWDGVRWAHRIAAGGPSGRSEHAAATAPGNGGIVIVGGFSQGGTLDDMWSFGWSADNQDDACVGAFDSDHDGFVACADPDCWPVCAPLCGPGISCEPQALRCGDQVCEDSVENCRNCPTDCTCSPTCGDFVCDPGEPCPGDC